MSIAMSITICMGLCSYGFGVYLAYVVLALRVVARIIMAYMVAVYTVI